MWSINSWKHLFTQYAPSNPWDSVLGFPFFKQICQVDVIQNEKLTVKWRVYILWSFKYLCVLYRIYRLHIISIHPIGWYGIQQVCRIALIAEYSKSRKLLLANVKDRCRGFSQSCTPVEREGPVTFKLLALAAGARGFSSPRLSAGKGNIQHRWNRKIYTQIK